jgi:hypothetical protein
MYDRQQRTRRHFGRRGHRHHSLRMDMEASDWGGDRPGRRRRRSRRGGFRTQASVLRWAADAGRSIPWATLATLAAHNRMTAKTGRLERRVVLSDSVLEPSTAGQHVAQDELEMRQRSDDLSVPPTVRAIPLSLRREGPRA